MQVASRTGAALRKADNGGSGATRGFVLLSSLAFALGFGVGGLSVGTSRERPTELHLPTGLLQFLAHAQHQLNQLSSAAIDAVATPSEPAEKTTEAAARIMAPPTPKPPGWWGGGEQADSGLAQIELRRGDTLMDVLSRVGIQATEAYDAVSSLREVADLRRLRAGQRLVIELAPVESEERLRKLVLPLDAATEVHLVRAEDGAFAARSVERRLQREMVRVGGEIRDSLFASAVTAGLPSSALHQMVKLLSWDVDLQRDVHPGDRFETVFERKINEAGEPAGGGDLLFVGLKLRGREIEAYRFTTADGRVGFFDGQGRTLRKWLLKTPVDGARLSSTFGPRRHPVLGYTRMHKGIDFVAPTGTPVLAAGDGVVEFAGRNRGYGKYIRLRHNGEYGTAYAHLSRFAPTIKRGRRVKQGEVIGYVGSTGMSTGPHLHYEMLQRGEQVNPLTLKAEFSDQLPNVDLRRFQELRAEIDDLRDRPERDQMLAERAE